MIEVTIPSPGESITQVQLASWLVKDGDYIEKDDEIAEIDSDKATLSISAEESGKIKIEAQEGDTLEVGAVIAKIDTEAPAPEKAKKEDQKKDAETKPQESEHKEQKSSSQQTTEKNKEIKAQDTDKSSDIKSEDQDLHVQITPLVKEILAQKGISEKELRESIYQLKISRKDIEPALKNAPKSAHQQQKPQSLWSGNRQTERKQMSTLRKKITERLVSVKNETAMLTTFNEVNMENIMTIRSKHKSEFLEKYGLKPGLMSFFTMASVQALQHFPSVNAHIDGEEIVYHHYADIGIAVSTPKGLLVPVLRDVENMGLAEIENSIKTKAEKAKNSKLTLDEMSGGTFTITNGGVFGSMLSTPIINPPQSAILGMHNIQDRPVAINGKVEIKPMMYLALSYDHRIIDGKDSVSFLVKIKELLENPVSMLFQGQDPEKQLLGL
ncbi:MAG: 2-oxoglutarate dehydrogenase complex dihydrolipoyllysine-residue succinyltransferase [Bacteroidota bacterium]